MIEWRLRPVSDLCSQIVDCVNKTAPISGAVTPFKMLRTTNIRNGWIDTSDTRRVDQATYERWTRRLRPQRGDIVLTREAPLGEVGMLRSDEPVFLGQRLVMYRADPAICDPHFLLYSMLGPSVQAELRSLGSGATVEHLRVPDCERLMIPCPDLAVQQRIGAVLSALDALIDNNHRRIKALEEMARAIYREWFIHFRYPGEEETPFVDSPFGPIPYRWSATRLHEVAKVNGASRVPNPDETIQYLDISALGERHVSPLTCIRGADAPGRARRVVAAGDVVWSMVRPNRRAHDLLVRPGGDWIASTGLAVLTPLRIPSSYLFEAVSSSKFSDYLVSRESGAAYPAVKPKDFENAPILLPTREILDRFDEAVSPMYQLAWNLRTGSLGLASLRDRLLPKLVEGQIDVSSLDLDALVEDSVA